MYTHFLQSVAWSRKKDTAVLRQLAVTGAIQTPNDALKNGLVDGLYYDDQIKSLILKKLSSAEKALNGKFNLKVDTLQLGPLAYKILIEIESKKTSLSFQREVLLQPWKPEFPKRGQV